MKSKKLKLSVREERKYKRLVKEQKEIRDRISYYETVGKSSPKIIIKEGASLIAKAIKQVPETYRRKSVELAKKLSIPKSPRGRKPIHQIGV